MRSRHSNAGPACGCNIHERAVGREDPRIDFCSMHEAAPALLAAIERVTSYLPNDEGGYDISPEDAAVLETALVAAKRPR